jgi:cysteine-rich repeat protein
MVTFMPAAEFSGEASFQYTISDGELEATATVTVTIAPVDDAPVAADQSVSSVEGAPVAITLTATDLDSPELTYTIETSPAHGSLTGTPPAVTYTPDLGYAGEDSFVFKAQGETASDLATVTITVTAAPPPPDLCGNGDLDNDEVCDDGNTDAGDGCRADCLGIEECGDGLVDALAGETCDDGGTALGDGCDDLCQLDPFVTVPPAQISVALGCTSNNSNTGRKITSDELGNFYVVMSCAGEGYIVTSTDRGTTWSAPAALGITGVSEIAVEGGSAGTAYVAAMANGDLVFTRTTDSGATWSAPSTIEAGIFDSEISMDTFESSVYLLASSGGELHLWSNHASGVGAFELTALPQANAFHEVIVDGISGAVFACSDTPAFHIRKSTNGGASFGDEMNPGGQAFFSDWAGSNGFIYVVGTSNDTNIEVIPVGDPASSTPVEGLPGTMTSSSRSIDADAIGNAYVASQMDDGSIQIDRMVFSATSILSADARNVDASGTMPGIAALPTNDGALYVFTKNGNEIWVGVTVY